ncbi:MAG: Cof-type HAD-IIB family hydrolase [Treponema sp.]|jgi:Cof subfamily protein (haloacid dehalogenase superfamily)|nr:Cof-type HAD-IIB family hydrolase [Treponema sp.]
MQKQLNSKTIKALALDLDGTALLPDNTLGERTAKCLRNLISRGIQVIFCTGRAIEGAERFRIAIGAEGPMVFFNGAEVADMPSGEIISADLLDLDVVNFGIDLARSMGVHYQIYLPAGTAVDGVKSKWEALVVDKPTPESEMYRNHTGIVPLVKDLKELCATPGLRGCVKVMFITDPARHDEIRQKTLDRFGSKVYVARTFPTFLEIMNAGVSKGEGLKTAMKRRGLEAGEVIALGDEENDLLMFNVAGFSAAPANAREKVRAAADLVFASNAGEGLAVFLEDLFKI